MTFSSNLGDEMLQYLMFPIIFLLINYAFFKLILRYIIFYNDLLVIYDGQLIVIKTSLIFKDDIEFIDVNKITKIDTFGRGLIANLIGFGTLVVEQQRDQVREFRYIPDPSRALHIIKTEKEKTIEESKKAILVNSTKK